MAAGNKRIRIEEGSDDEGHYEDDTAENLSPTSKKMYMKFEARGNAMMNDSEYISSETCFQLVKQQTGSWKTSPERLQLIQRNREPMWHVDQAITFMREAGVAVQNNQQYAHALVAFSMDSDERVANFVGHVFSASFLRRVQAVYTENQKFTSALADQWGTKRYSDWKEYWSTPYRVHQPQDSGPSPFDI